MKICMFTNTYIPHVGGVARSVSRFAEDLRHMGHRVLVVAPAFEATAPASESGILRLPAIQNFNGSDFSVRIPIPLVVEHEIEAFQPDIVHSHHPFLLGDTALRVARKHKVPLVFTHHTRYEQYTHYVPLNADRMASFVINLATVYANFCSGVIAPSKSIARLIQSRGVEVPVEIIPTGVDTERFGNGDGARFKRKWKIPADVTVIGHVGRLTPEKNLDYLTTGVAQCLSLSENAVFLVIGDGPGRQTIVDDFRKARLEDRIVMTGAQDGKDLVDAYAAMDLFAFSSLSETQGMVLAEAMAAGVPVIALAASGVRDILEDGRNGRMLSQESSATAFAHALHAAIHDAKARQTWQEGAIRTAKAHSRGKCAQRLVSFYSERINAAPSGDHRHSFDLGVLDRVLERIHTEWQLIAAKVKSAAETSVDQDGQDMAST